jgi:hypothetical protein
MRHVFEASASPTLLECRRRVAKNVSELRDVAPEVVDEEVGLCLLEIVVSRFWRLHEPTCLGNAGVRVEGV